MIKPRSRHAKPLAQCKTQTLLQWAEQGVRAYDEIERLKQRNRELHAICLSMRDALNKAASKLDGQAMVDAITQASVDIPDAT